MEIDIRINTYDCSTGTPRHANILRKLADALDEHPDIDVTIHTVEGKEELAKENCNLDESVKSVQVEAEKELAKRKKPEEEEPKKEEKPKRKRRTKAEMEAARAKEAEEKAAKEAKVSEKQVEEYVKQQEPDGAADPIDAALDALDQPDQDPPPPADVDDPAAALRDMMVKLVKKYGSEGPQMMAKTVERITGHTDITKVPEERFAAVYAALNQLLQAEPPEANDDGFDY